MSTTIITMIFMTRGIVFTVPDFVLDSVIMLTWVMAGATVMAWVGILGDLPMASILGVIISITILGEQAGA